MTDKPLLCMVTNTKSNDEGEGVFVVINQSTEIIGLKYQVSQRLKIPLHSLSLKFISEREKKFSFAIDNDDDLRLMFEYCGRNGYTDINLYATSAGESSNSQNTQTSPENVSIPTENSRCAAASITQPCNDERIPNDNPTGDTIMMIEDMVNNQINIPDEWHTAISHNGQKFNSADEVRLALQYYSIAKRFEYDFYHNEQRRIRVHCRFRKMKDCPWMLFASPLRNSSIMAIKKFCSTHTCGQHGANAGNSRASRKFIAYQIQSVLKVRPDLRPIDIKKDLYSNYGININYSKAWQSKERAQQDLFGDDDEAYDSLRWYEAMVQATNPGSRVAIDANGGTFRRLFISYNACIEGFIAGCRPLLFLDGTFLKDRYRGILLSATGYDGNQGIFPLAYCVCDQENEENWKWFLQGVWTILYEREKPYDPPHQLVMISDADKGIRSAVEEFFPNAFHSRCVLHLVENFKKK